MAHVRHARRTEALVIDRGERSFFDGSLWSLQLDPSLLVVGEGARERAGASGRERRKRLGRRRIDVTERACVRVARDDRGHAERDAEEKAPTHAASIRHDGGAEKMRGSRQDRWRARRDRQRG
jgi:hypothetical protein